MNASALGQQRVAGRRALAPGEWWGSFSGARIAAFDRGAVGLGRPHWGVTLPGEAAPLAWAPPPKRSPVAPLLAPRPRPDVPLPLP